MDTVERTNEVAAPYVGFDISLIIMTLLPFLAQCFKQQNPTQDPREYLRRQYDPQADRFPRRLVARVLPQVRRAAQEQGKHLNHKQAVQIAETSLKESMLADDGEVNRYMNGLTAVPVSPQEEVDDDEE